MLLAVSPAHAQVAAGYSEYYIPGDETNMRLVFDSLGTAGTDSPDMHAVITVTAWSANTTVYYDHWEDGYDFDPANPGTADETYTLSTGVPLVFESANIGDPRTSSTTCERTATERLITAGTTTCYDGGDRIYVAGGVVTVTRAGWIEDAGRRPTRRRRGRSTRSSRSSRPTSCPSARTWRLKSYLDFRRVSVLVQATADDTTFTVDLDGNGTCGPARHEPRRRRSDVDHASRCSAARPSSSTDASACRGRPGPTRHHQQQP